MTFGLKILVFEGMIVSQTKKLKENCQKREML